MDIKKLGNRYFFTNDESGNKDYLEHISKEVDSDNLNSNLTIASVTGKYIVDMISGVCGECGIQYSVSENSLVWICPICKHINISDKKYNIYVKDITKTKVIIIIKRRN